MTNSELERVYEGEIIQPDDRWELYVSEWTEGQRQELTGKLRMARAAASVKREYGKASVKGFAREVGYAESTVYQYIQAWERFKERFENSIQIESPLYWTHYTKALSHPDPDYAIEEAEVNGWDIPTFSAWIKEENQQKAEEDHGPPQKVKAIKCDKCDGRGEIIVE